MPDYTPLIYVMTAAIVVAAVAILVQTGLLYGMYKASNAMKLQVSSVAAKAEPLIESSQRVVELTRTQVSDLTAKASQMLDLSQKQLVRIDEVLAEATTRTRVQMDRIEMVVDDTVNRFQETTALLQTGILKPVRQINGIAVGLATALSVLMRSGRTTPEQATHDEEMFI